MRRTYLWEGRRGQGNVPDATQQAFFLEIIRHSAFPGASWAPHIFIAWRRARHAGHGAARTGFSFITTPLSGCGSMPRRGQTTCKKGNRLNASSGSGSETSAQLALEVLVATPPVLQRPTAADGKPFNLTVVFTRWPNVVRRMLPLVPATFERGPSLLPPHHPQILPA